MIKRVREQVGRWMRRGAGATAPDALLFADHEEIRDISRQIRRTKVEMDRSVLSMRSWARDLGRRLAEGPRGLSRNEDLRALGETVGGLAHNFNNSLAAILAYTELMLRESESEAARRRLMVIRDVALEASATVRKLQEFVSRQPQVAFGPVGLPAVIAEALELTAPRWRDEAERKGTVIAVTQDMEALPPVEGNAFELRDALVRLINNAVDPSPRDGSPAMRAAWEAPGWVVVEVRASGTGMSDEMRRRLAEHARGLQSGQGLAHVYDIVERHGGSVAIDSEIGKGTTVRLRLHASRFQIIPASEGPAERQTPPEQAARVLLVDDDPRLLTVLSDVLRSEGHAITVAANGEEAVAVFDPAAHDVVITDLGMPRMNGWEVAERIKTRSPATAVFILTGWGEGVSAHESMQFVDRVIAKPVSAEALLEQLAGLTRSRVPPA